jgi:hypothetical protein
MRVHQALGTAWAARSSGSPALAACYLGPSELDRPEPLDALQRALGLGAPLLCFLVGPKSVTERWLWVLADHDVPHAFADGSDLVSVLSMTQKLAARARAEHLPAAVVCEERPDLDPLQRYADAQSPAVLGLAAEPALRRSVHAEVEHALVDALGPGRAHLILRSLDAHDTERR